MSGDTETGSAPPHRGPPRWLLVTGDLVAVAGIVAVLLYQQTRVHMGPAGDAYPGWASPYDTYLIGPDAGEWANAARLVAEGRIDEVDPHRPPTWVLLTALFSRLLGVDVVLAGHAVNHLIGVLGPVVVYALGRRLGLGGLAIAAAVVSGTLLQTAYAVTNYCIDAAVTYALPTLLFVASFAGRGRLAAVGAGVLGAFAAFTHLLLMPLSVLGVLMATTTAPRGRRLATGAVFAATILAMALAVFALYPHLGVGDLGDAFAEGAARQRNVSATPTEALGRLAAATRVAVAVDWRDLNWRAGWLAAHALPRGIPAVLVGTLCLLGAWGPFTASPGGASQPGWRSGVAGGLPLAGVLLFLVALTAVRAPERYGFDLVACLALLAMRGIYACLAIAAALATRAVPAGFRAAAVTWAPGVLAALLGVGFAADAALNQSPMQIQMRQPPVMPNDEDARRLGTALAAWPANTPVVSYEKEALVYANTWSCVLASCPEEESPGGFEQCRDRAAAACPGEGDLLWVLSSRPDPYKVSVARLTVDAWAGATFPVVLTVDGTMTTFTVVAVPRTGLGTP